MTKFLDPKLVSSKASRKERKQISQAEESSATERAVASLRRSLGKDLKKSDNKERLITKAINETMGDFIAAMDEDVLAPFFFSLERLATPPNRRRIALHPLRPEKVDEMHDEADEEEELVFEEDEQAAAKAGELESKAVKAVPQAEVPAAAGDGKPAA